tara:strand:- start:1830 stop:2165 length:336 start_codon:yes stop_codon:yes gene_type:complete
MAVKAKLKGVGMSRKRLQPAVDIVRGKKVQEALDILSLQPGPAAEQVAKVLRSAASNAENNAQLNMNKLRVVRASADQGPVLRRWKAKARGRVGRIRRPSSLIIIEVDEEA